MARQNLNYAKTTLDYYESRFEPKLGISYQKKFNVNYSLLSLNFTKEYKYFGINMSYAYAPDSLSKNRLTLGLSTDFWQKNRLWNDLILQKKSFESANLSYKNKIRTIVYNLKTLYINVEYNRSLVFLSKKEISLAQRLFSITSAEFNVGKKSYLDYISAKTSFLNTKRKIAQYESTLLNSKRTFASQTGTASLTFSDNFNDTSVTHSIMALTSQLPDTEQVLNNYEVRILSIEQARQRIILNTKKAEFIPNINLQANYTFSQTPAPDYFQLNQDISVSPFLLQYRSNNKITENMIKIEGLLIKNKRRDLLLDYQNSLQDLKADLNSLKIVDEQSSLKNEQLALSFDSYKAGKESLSDYLLVQNQFVSLKENRIALVKSIFNLINEIDYLGWRK